MAPKARLSAKGLSVLEKNMDPIPTTAGFKAPEGLLGRFGVIKLWPDIQVAEDEVIARLDNTAKLLGLECVVLDHMGRPLHEGGEPLTQKDLDFVIHLHFSTPKTYDIFSFVTLWNPVPFFHDFGYRSTSENLLTHDDFLSCQSPGADLHLRRLITDSNSHLAPSFNLFHALSTPILPPTLGDLKIFYMGINWERLGRGGSRHQTVLNILDQSSMMRIYGPETLRGVRVWEGFDSYQRSLPFDGISVIEEIHKAGICLALSSEQHKDAVLMSNRLFEGLAAGALIICDENPWARQHFGDSLLYVDLRNGAEPVARRIMEHVEWARTNPEEALALAARAQEIFKRGYTMDASLAAIYGGLEARKAELAALLRPVGDETATRIVFLAPDPEAEYFERQVEAARAHRAQGYEAVLLVDERDLRAAGKRLSAMAQGDAVPPALRGAAFFQRDSTGKVVRRNRIGTILKAEFQAAPEGSALLFAAPNETLFSNHVAILAALLSRHPEADYAHSKAITRLTDGKGEPFFGVENEFDPLSRDPGAPIGLGRFLFRAGAFHEPVDLLLESLDLRAASGLALYAKGVSTGRASLIVDRRKPFHLGLIDGGEGERDLHGELRPDLEAIRDLHPARFDELDRANRLREELRDVDTRHQASADVLHKAFGDFHTAFIDTRDTVRGMGAQGGAAGGSPLALSFDQLSIGNRRVLIYQLLQALPVPRVVWRGLRGLARGVRALLRPFRGG